MKNLIRILNYTNQVVFPAAIVAGLIILLIYNITYYGLS
jgi:hypothetical protein